MAVFANQAELQAQAIQAIGDRRLRVDGREFPFFANVSPDDLEAPGGEAVIVVHGALRNAGEYYAIVEAAAGGARTPVIVAPQFLTTADIQGHPELDGLVYWETEDWKGGLGEVSSFKVMDVLLTWLLKLHGIRRVTIAGNSAGGQFVNRYAAVGRGPEAGREKVRFVVANPSTYLYFDRRRPSADGFGLVDDPDVDRWRYGFGDPRPAYVNESADFYLDQYLARDVVYLLGEQDADPGAALLEVHPAALAQGSVRLDRGLNYDDYLRFMARGRTAYRHRLVRVPGVGHDARDVFCSPQGQECLFG